MNLFWDTSAILALVFKEPHSQEAQLASDAATRSLAWRWLKAEAVSALARRRAGQPDWEQLQAILPALEYVYMSTADLEDVCLANRDWRLRAADAGHLYCFQQTTFVLRDIQLVCFDDEMRETVRRCGLRLWSPSPGEAAKAPRVREHPARYGRKSNAVTR